MGPRSFDRGNVRKTRLKRQWKLRFNGAAVFRPRKQTGRAKMGLYTVDASMGPRSFDRGNGGHVNYFLVKDLAVRMRATTSPTQEFQPFLAHSSAHLTEKHSILAVASVFGVSRAAWPLATIG